MYNVTFVLCGFMYISEEVSDSWNGFAVVQKSESEDQKVFSLTSN